MREDTTIPFWNPAYRRELSELARAGAEGAFPRVCGNGKRGVRE